MRIGIDARMLDNTGIGRYLRNLLIHLARKDQQNEYIIFVNKDHTQVVTQENFLFVPLKIHVPLYSLQEQSWFPLEIRKWKLDLIHYPNFNIPFIQFCPYVVTIHDLIYYLYPDQCPSKFAYYYACSMIRYATKHARTVMTVSEHSKKDLIRYFNIPEHKIQIISEAADGNCYVFHPRSTARDNGLVHHLRAKYRIAQPYIFYVGKHHPYKNIKTLIHAYHTHKEIYENFQLVIAGKKDNRRQELYTSAEQLDTGNQIIFTDFIPEEEIFELYRGASLFVFPSLYEGFGLPPLEAMACGVPVISSNAASLPEVVGDAAMLVDPQNVTELAAAIQSILTDDLMWATFRQRGLDRAQQFSWDTAAMQLLQLYTGQITT